MLPRGQSPLPSGWFRDKDAPVVEEGTDDFGSDWVELQVRDVVEVLLAGSQEGEAPRRERGGKKSRSYVMFTPCQALFLNPGQVP